MSDRFESRERLAAKIEWEGGVLESVDYGIRVDHLPEGDTELAKAWGEMAEMYQKASALARKVHALLEPHGLA